MSALWNGALTILNGDEREWKQMVPRDLDNEEYFGRDHMRQLMSTRVQSGAFDSFLRQIQPFLLVITHSSFLDCLSVDTFVGGLYNFIGGTNGTRAVPFFQHLCENLVLAHVEETSLTGPATIETTLIAASITLRELLRRESRARFNDDLEGLIGSIENAVHLINGDGPSHMTALVTSHIREMRAMIARARGLLAPEQEPQEAHAGIMATSRYPRVMDMPRDRHDNDKADIMKIKIFPTREEIVTDEPDFLPSTDRDEPSFLADEGVRHIDTHFRLLRYDTFGQLKDLLGGVADAVKQNPNLPKVDLGDFRANKYANACISYVGFDSRQGLSMSVTFTQPLIMFKMPASEKIKWWKESRRLTDGVLLSFISFQGGELHPLFFVATETKTETNKDRREKNRDDQITITAKLVDHDVVNVESAVRLSYEKVKGLLIEYPGVLPATFVTILENLQDMQRHSRLPFCQWILPGKLNDAGGAAEVHIPPPLYSRVPGFRFSLESLLKEGEPRDPGIFIDPFSSANDADLLSEMERRRNLDRGQCQALLQALIRVYVLTQGPPGTGKSFLGIQLMKVLMHCKKTTELGPVLRTTNRINVLLTRAQHGMYLIGNVETYSNIPMWQKVIEMLRSSDSLGGSLGLCCPRHQDTAIQVSEPDDFPRLSPEGGPELSVNQVFYSILPSKPEFDQICAENPLKFAPGMLSVLESPSPPQFAFFESPPTLDSDEDLWAVYIVLLILRDGTIQQKLVYTGSGTDSIDGADARLEVYSTRDSPKLPSRVRAAFDKGARLHHVGLLCWSPLPPVSLVPRARARFLAVEALFTTIFSSSQHTTPSNQIRMIILRPNALERSAIWRVPWRECPREKCYMEGARERVPWREVLYGGCSGESALERCVMGEWFRDNGKHALFKLPFLNADKLHVAVEESLKILGEGWYESVSAEELTAIKQATLSGRSGIATHSGHWYNCVNGHPFAIGECGMPMEQARCPECGAPIGGSHHQAVDGVTRAVDMES
ncbi:hypothetical protein PV10_07129 [Exophiala mesophila]|uniref:RZ-type domain-containing protein n=1 Tax=Exophiala mesophila TaxID=212818 RepID=A0A0D1Z759_EXOME|nr:uncharacterized protein PV10_07129 [Exophiala mesophila]KIV89749.1 hypothetical protein PV10_07129 [Exophiala mesophila]